MKIEKRSVDSLVPYAQNARLHSETQVAQIGASIREFGFLNPVLVDGESGIIAGHGRVLAAKLLGLKSVPCIEVAHLTDEQRRAYVLADNKLAENADWSRDLLRIELSELQAADFDTLLTGFSENELAELTGQQFEGLTDPDEAPELPDEPRTQPGDIWTLGKHRLVCGDSTSADDVARCLNGVEPHLMVTDPPYGVDYDPDWRNKTNFAANRATGLVRNDNNADWREAWALFPGDVAYVWHGGLHSNLVAESLESVGLNMRAQIIWVKQNQVFSRGDYHWKHEPCWYAVRKNRKGYYCGGRKQTTVWEIANANPMAGNNETQTGHSTQKPVECMRRPIVNNSSPGQAVYDPFLGSGTTVVAAEMEGRCCYGLEIDPAYCDVIVKRWQDFTGEDATLDSTGETFAARTQTKADAPEGHRRESRKASAEQGRAEV